MENRHRYIYFYTLDAGGNYTTLGYTLPICPFTFIPIFDDGTENQYSKQNILWDFGDGTTSHELTATHYYSNPGWYDVKCYVLGEKGVGYEDSFSQSILVKNYITDSISLTSKDVIKEAGSFLQFPKTVYIQNSWQTYSSVSANGGYTINLQSSAANAPTLDVEKYNKDKFGHLKPSAKFLAYNYNNYTEKMELLPVNNIKVPCELLYATWNNGELQTLTQNEILSCKTEYCFAGTKGNETFYFNDDLATTSPTEIVKPAIIYVSFDKSQFKDLDNYNKDYEQQSYNILNGLFSSTTDKTIEQSKDKKILTFSSNGIDDDNGQTRIDTFNISPIKYTGQKIPFVVRVKTYSIDGDNAEIIRPSKYTSTLHYYGKSTKLSGTNIVLQLKQNGKVIDDVEFYEDFGPLSAENKGGYFRGYLISNNQYNNVRIHAEALPDFKQRLLAETKYAAIGEPSLFKIHNLLIQSDYNNPANKTIVDRTFNTTNLSGIYTTCITTVKDFVTDDISTYIWLIDSDSDIIKKYNADTMNELYSFSLSRDFGIPYGSPSNIAGDKEGNVWVTLYDSISTIRINNISNLIDRYIVPSISNTITNYENSLTPASVDVDIENNVWVCYSNSTTAFIEKYSPDGYHLNTFSFQYGYQPTEICIDNEGNAWCILKDQMTDTDTLYGYSDKVIKISPSRDITYYNVGGSLWNLTTDNNNNVWITRNRNQVARINSYYESISIFTLQSNSSDEYEDNINYTSDLEGITTTTDNVIWIVDNFNKCIHSFFAEALLNINIYIVPLNDFNQEKTKINAYGDWNGYRMINKFLRTKNYTRAAIGDSNTFSILSSPLYDIRKISENFDPKEHLKSLRFQESIQNTNVLFDNFLGNALGTENSDPNSLGKRIYEKISNFSDNIANVDVCNIEALKSMHSMLGEEFLSLHGDNLNIPSDLFRLIDLFSINYSKLKGSRNKYGLDFDTKGYNNDIIRSNGGEILYGKNKGSEINFLTGILSAGIPIIAYERFSDTYTLLNTNLLSSAYLNFINPTTKIFALSTYHTNWGWDLVLPNDYVLSSYQIPKYYTFYNYVSGYSDEQSEGLINWSDTNTKINENISSTEEWDEIRDNMISYTLAKGLNVI